MVYFSFVPSLEYIHGQKYSTLTGYWLQYRNIKVKTEGSPEHLIISPGP